MRPTVPYHPTPEERAEELLRLAELKGGEVLYDLGCGKGNILIVGAEKFGAQCVGIENDANLVEEARNRVRERGLEERITVVEGDILSPEFWGQGNRYSVSEADVVAMYLNYEMHKEVVPLLERELQLGARVVSYEFFVRGWEPLREAPMMFAFQKGKSF